MQINRPRGDGALTIAECLSAAAEDGDQQNDDEDPNVAELELSMMSETRRMSVILSEALKDPLLTMSQVAQFEIEIARLQGAGMDAESVEYKILPAVRRIVLRAEFGLEREIYL